MMPAAPHHFALKALSMSALLTLSSVAFAAPTPYSSLTSFMAATSAAGTDRLDDISIASPTGSPLMRTAGTYTYSAMADGAFFGAGTGPDYWLSTNIATDSIVFGNFTSGVAAIGGFFFGSDIAGLFDAGSILVSATDATGTATQTIDGAMIDSFFGFVSSGALTSLTVTSLQPAGGFLWPTVNDLVLARAAAATVPEPSTTVLLAFGLCALTVATRRRTRPCARPGGTFALFDPIAHRMSAAKEAA